MKHGLSIVLVCGISFGAHAETHRMIQADKTFLGNITEAQALEVFEDPSIEEKHRVEKLSAKVGDSIRFMNRDEVNHNVSGLMGTETAFDVKLQEPGTANDKEIVLKKKGEYTIQCAIHPKMKFHVKVD